MINILPEDYSSLHDSDRENWDHIRACLLEVEKDFSMRSTSNPRVNHFHILAAKMKRVHFHTWLIERSGHSFRLCLVQYDILYAPRPRSNERGIDSSLYFIGQLDLKKDFGVAVIRPETLEDKINELFEPIEMDFKSHLLFSFRFFVMAEDKARFREMLPPALLSFMESYPGLQLEFKHQQCLFRMPKTFDLNYGLLSCEVGLGLDKILNR